MYPKASNGKLNSVYSDLHSMFAKACLSKPEVNIYSTVFAVISAQCAFFFFTIAFKMLS